MCEPVSMGIMAAASVGTLLMQDSAQRRAQANQTNAINAQNRKQKEAEDAAAAIGPAAKSIDLAKEASAYQDLKRNKVAMQQGILGTMKTNPLSAGAPVTTQKTTLGS